MPFALLGIERRGFVDEAEGRRRDRDLALHAGRGPLAIEGRVVAAHQCREDQVRLGSLDLGDRRPEVGDVEREEFGGEDRAAVVLAILRHPLGRDLTVVVIGRNDIGLFAALAHGIGDELLDRLGRRRPEAELVAVAHAAFVKRIVEVKHLEPVEHRADRLAGRRGDAAMHNRDLVLQGQLLRIL